MSQEQRRREAFESQLVSAVLILGRLAVSQPSAILGNSERIKMRQELFAVLESMNDLRVKVSNGTS